VLLPRRDQAALERMDLDSLIGMPVPQARAVVEKLDGVLRAVVEGGAITLDYRPDRVTVVVDAVDCVVRVLGRA